MNTKKTDTNKSNTKQAVNICVLALTGIMTAVTCILGPLSIPIGIVPISLTNFTIYLAVIILGWKKGTLSYLIYLLIGLVGLPVFSGFTGGAGKLFGPTGGYLVGFILMAVISGFFAEKFHRNRYLCFAGMVLATIVAYGFGTVWLAYQASMTFPAALAAGVIPFIPGDLIKIVIAMFLGGIIKKQLNQARLI